MKKIFGFMMLALMCVVTMTKKKKTTINRMVLKAAQEFNAVVVSGDVTVELRFNPEKAGYIVYHYDKNVEKHYKDYIRTNEIWNTLKGEINNEVN